MLDCVDAQPGGGFLAHFGYQNPNPDPVVAPFENTFVPDPADRNQPTVFKPGRVEDAFQAASTGPAFTWKLTGNRVTASSDSKPSCRSSITIIKVLHPSNDPGRFHLKIDDVTPGDTPAVGDGGTTGTIAVSPGAHTVGESAAQGTSLADYVVQIVCVSGDKVVAEAASATVSVPVQRGDDVLCTITNTRKSELKPLVAVLECVVFRGAAPEQAVWGYRNDNDFPVQVPIGATNEFSPVPADRGQPKLFEPGRWTGIFQIPFGNAGTLTWTLAGQTVTASSASTRCSAILQLRKVTAPAGDPGVFNLLLNRRVLASSGNGPLPVLTRWVSGRGQSVRLQALARTWPTTNRPSPAPETAGRTCRSRGRRSTAGSRTANSSSARSPTAASRRRRHPSRRTRLSRRGRRRPRILHHDTHTAARPTSRPDDREDGAADDGSSRPTDQLDDQGDERLPGRAADVNVVKVTERPYRTTLISVTSSQGTCSRTSCDLGRLAPGASATITAVTRATQIGEILNVVRVGSEEQESNYLNNTASNLVRVVGPFRPPPQQAACRTLGAAPRQLQAGTTSIVRTTARNRFGLPVAGVKVRARGPGVNGQATTNSRGIARFTVTPSASGFVTFRGTGRSLAAVGPVCATYLAALSAGRLGSVTG